MKKIVAILCISTIANATQVTIDNTHGSQKISIVVNMTKSLLCPTQKTYSAEAGQYVANTLGIGDCVIASVERAKDEEKTKEKVETHVTLPIKSNHDITIYDNYEVWDDQTNTLIGTILTQDLGKLPTEAPGLHIGLTN